MFNLGEVDFRLACCRFFPSPWMKAHERVLLFCWLENCWRLAIKSSYLGSDDGTGKNGEQGENYLDWGKDCPDSGSKELWFILLNINLCSNGKQGNIEAWTNLIDLKKIKMLMNSLKHIFSLWHFAFFFKSCIFPKIKTI